MDDLNICRCHTCDKELRNVDDNDDVCIVNAGLETEFVECWVCHEDALDNGIETHCECCQELFTYDELLVNPATGEKELCPYCGEVWCD